MAVSDNLLQLALPHVYNKFVAQSRNLGNSPTQQRQYNMKANQLQVMALAKKYGMGYDMQQLGQGRPYGEE